MNRISESPQWLNDCRERWPHTQRLLQEGDEESIGKDRLVSTRSLGYGIDIAAVGLLGMVRCRHHDRSGFFRSSQSCTIVVHYSASDPQSDYRPVAPRISWLLDEKQAKFGLPSIPAADPDNFPELTAETALAVLRNPSESSAHRRAVLSAEALEFSPEESQEVCDLLRQYIIAYRSNSDHDTEVAVASAVRTHVALLSASRLDKIAELLDATTALPQPFQSEVAKMVVRKMTAVPPDRADQFPALAGQLAELASAYLHPLHLARPYCGAIALNSVLALALLRTQQWQEIAHQVRKLNAGWFRQQLGRRAGRIASELSIRFPRSQVQSQLDMLQALVDMSKV